MQQRYAEFKKTNPNTTFEEYQRQPYPTAPIKKESSFFSAGIGNMILSAITPTIGNAMRLSAKNSNEVTPQINQPQQSSTINANYNSNKTAEKKDYNDLLRETRETNKLIKEQNQLMAKVADRPIETKISPYTITNTVSSYGPKQSSRLGSYNT
jgi:hypothetical protein